MEDKEIIKVGNKYYKPLIEYLTYDKDCGFNIVKAINEEDAECNTNAIVLEENRIVYRLIMITLAAF